MSTSQPIRRALLSVSDKTGIVEFATALAAQDIELLSTGGTAKLLAEAGLNVIEVSDWGIRNVDDLVETPQNSRWNFSPSWYRW